MQSRLCRNEILEDKTQRKYRTFYKAVNLYRVYMKGAALETKNSQINAENFYITKSPFYLASGNETQLFETAIGGVK